MVTRKERDEFVRRMHEAYDEAVEKLPVTAHPIPIDWVWPQAALESDWGTSGVARDCNNLFGMKGAHFGQGVCEKHHPPSAEGPRPYTRFDSWADCLAGYMRKVTTKGNLFRPCYERGLKFGQDAYWQCLQEHEWAGKNQHYARSIRSVYYSYMKSKMLSDDE